MNTPAFRVDLMDGRWLVVPDAPDEEAARGIVERCFLGVEIDRITPALPSRS